MSECLKEIPLPGRINALDAKAARLTLMENTAEFSGLFSCRDKDVELVAAACSLSPFLADCVRQEDQFVVRAFGHGFDVSAERVINDTLGLMKEGHDEAELMRDLRVAKRRIALLCGLADIGGIWDAPVVTRVLSRFAGAALSAALGFVLLRAHEAGKLDLKDCENPQSDCGLIVLGMGKFGADELNYSSDIDLIVLFDEHACVKLNTDDPITLLVRLVKQLVRIMQERTSEGYVFRTDLRLRPDPSSTPIVLPVEAAINYYEAQGQNWERAAMIKATPVAGDIAAGNRFLKDIAPFVWRKYLDFAAIRDVHSIKRQIHAHKGHGRIAVYGHNIKLGRGGIREIEFFAQTQQLIAGGRNPLLRQKKTVEALRFLAEQGWIKSEAARELIAAYWFLRNLEHRLQMVDDRQTHSLPDCEGSLNHIANMFAISGVTKFIAVIENCLRLVERHYAGLFEDAHELSSGTGNLVFTGDDEDPDTRETLASMGYERPSEVIKTVKQWYIAKVPALQTGTARELLTELVPDLLQTFSKSADPDTVLYTFDRFIAGLPAGIQLFAILKSNPSLNLLLVRILTVAPVLADQIARKPHVFDAMLEPYIDMDGHAYENLVSMLAEGMERIGLYEAKLDFARRFYHEARFRIACRFLSGNFNSENTALALSDLAEAVISVMLDVVKKEFAVLHGNVSGAQTLILAMGRLGSRELTADSDLDLIFLYDFPEESAYSDGSKPLDSTLYFIRLVKRFITAMSALTAEGRIFDLDFRLRPSGNAGPLATRLEGFFKYQKSDAWIWEAQALTRARGVAGDLAIRMRLDKEIPQLLRRFSKNSDLKAEIFKMRMRIEAEKGTRHVWDMKTGEGGLLDIEFIAQWLALLHISDAPVPVGTGKVIALLGEKSLASVEVDILLKAFNSFTTVLQLQRICLGTKAMDEVMPQGFVDLICSALDFPDQLVCEAHLGATKRKVRKLFNTILGPDDVPDKTDGSGQTP